MERLKCLTGIFLVGTGLISSVGLSLAFATRFVTARSQDYSISIVTEPKVISVLRDEHVLLRYRYNDVPCKPYADQLFSPRGVNVLRDAPADHQHHHGLMFAVAVDGVNFWEEHKAPGRQVHRSFSDVAAGRKPGDVNVPQGTFTEHIDWVNPRSQELLLKERRAIEVCQLKDAQVTLLTWQSSLGVPPGKESVMIAGSHYFGLGMRFVQSMDTGGHFCNAEGKMGEVVRGDERLICSKWCAYTASANGQPVTVAMFDYPHNRRQATWFTMAKPFAYLSATLNLHKEPLKLTSDTPVVLRYGVALWDGKVEEEQIEQLYQQWILWADERKTTHKQGTN